MLAVGGQLKVGEGGGPGRQVHGVQVRFVVRQLLAYKSELRIWVFDPVFWKIGYGSNFFTEDRILTKLFLEGFIRIRSNSTWI